MSIKEELLKIRKILSIINEEKLNYNNNHSNTTIDLDAKVNEFIKWYYENMVKGNYTDIGEYHELKKMRNLIDKMAVWYELRYPDYEINRLMHCCGQEQININDVMFKNNSYVNDLLDDEDDYKKLDWDEFYNTNVFMKSLPFEERYYFDKPRYRDLVYLNPNSRKAHLHLTKNGYVETSQGVTDYTKSLITDEELQGLNIRKVIDLFREKNIELPKNNELEQSIKDIDNLTRQKEEILNCVMYRIIERGGNRIGPQRAFLFAKEFGRNIDIPMKYGIDYSDPGLRLFINEYIKAGGSKDLKCYIGYFFRTNKNEKLDTISIQDVLLKQNNYTLEENQLHQKLVNIINNYINLEDVKKEEVKKITI